MLWRSQVPNTRNYETIENRIRWDTDWIPSTRVKEPVGSIGESIVSRHNWVAPPKYCCKWYALVDEWSSHEIWTRRQCHADTKPPGHCVGPSINCDETKGQSRSRWPLHAWEGKYSQLAVCHVYRQLEVEPFDQHVSDLKSWANIFERAVDCRDAAVRQSHSVWRLTYRSKQWFKVMGIVWRPRSVSWGRTGVGPMWEAITDTEGVGMWQRNQIALTYYQVHTWTSIGWSSQKI